MLMVKMDVDVEVQHSVDHHITAAINGKANVHQRENYALEQIMD